MNRLIDSCFLSVVALLSRGWIVPVGGSTPDRLKVGGSIPDRLRYDRLKVGGSIPDRLIPDRRVLTGLRLGYILFSIGAEI